MNNFKKELSLINVLKEHHESEELVDILATLASYDIKGDDYIKFYESLIPENIKEQLSDAINGGDEIEKEKAWKTIINALGVEKIHKIINNSNVCVTRRSYLESQISDIKKRLYKDSFDEFLNL